MEQDLKGCVSGLPEAPPAATMFQASSDTSLFSSSLPVIPHTKLNLIDSQSCDGEDPVGDMTPSLLPGDEDELLAGIVDDFDLGDLPTQLEDMEDDDLFHSGGGMEMEKDTEPQEGLLFGLPPLVNGVGTVAGEHPYGEHPSRTLFVRNINSNVEDSELTSLFEQYGEIRNVYTACKHRGFVMISYYDIRDARIAMRELQNKPLRRRKLDIHFSIPKDNPSEKDINQGTLVVFNLDPSVSNDDLCRIFGAYGEVKEIRETPHKRHHKFIEFFDVRAAEVALKALNGSEIAGKRIKLEPSRPGGARRSLMQQLSQEDETRRLWHHVGLPVKMAPIGKEQGRRTSFGDSNSIPDGLSGPQFLWGSPTSSSSSSSSSSWWASSVGSFASTNHHATFLLQPQSAPSETAFMGISPVSMIMSKGPMLYPGMGSRNELELLYQIDLDKIRSGKDARTTLMIKNIPNKYTSKMLVAAIDESHKGTYDFLYLPIDFKNKCNVGYAFINMVSPWHILSFYEALNGKKWGKFNSEKVGLLAYARIQGKVALIKHFQNSSLMKEDKWCRPILFQSPGVEHQDPLPYNNLNVCIRQPDGSYSVEENSI